MNEADVARFWAKVSKGDGCWEWQGGCDRAGYGQFSAGGRKLRAHRVSYRVASGTDPGALDVLHRCDNPACVRPDHLYLGTDAENAADRKGRGRSRNGGQPLTWEVVRAMRKAFLEEGLTYREVDERFGVRAASGVLSNRTWHDPTYEPRRGPGRRARLVEIGGVSKTLRGWSEDARCQVTYGTLRKKWAEGVRGVALLLKDKEGRPRKPDSGRLALARRLDAAAEPPAEVNRRLAEAGHRRLARAEWLGLHREFRVAPEAHETLLRVSLFSEYRRRQVAKDLGVPLSVVWGYRAGAGGREVR